MEGQACNTSSSNEVTLDSSYGWEDTKIGLNSGFGIMVLCPVSTLFEACFVVSDIRASPK